MDYETDIHLVMDLKEPIKHCPCCNSISDVKIHYTNGEFTCMCFNPQCHNIVFSNEEANCPCDTIEDAIESWNNSVSIYDLFCKKPSELKEYQQLSLKTFLKVNMDDIESKDFEAFYNEFINSTSNLKFLFTLGGLSLLDFCFALKENELLDE